ncbi:MAG TPA: DUF488 family protein [Chloroflexota bacterium]|jgi:uncharacterized protein YeaO (DUF488 family)
MIRRKRVYDAPEVDDGYRVLVERLWPRGLRKAALPLDAWEREIAPTTELRRWYGHEPDKWAEFQTRYERELHEPEAQVILDALVERAHRGKVTLLYSARDGDHSNAAVLERVLAARLAAQGR